MITCFLDRNEVFNNLLFSLDELLELGTVRRPRAVDHVLEFLDKGFHMGMKDHSKAFPGFEVVPTATPVTTVWHTKLSLNSYQRKWHLKFFQFLVCKRMFAWPAKVFRKHMPGVWNDTLKPFLVPFPFPFSLPLFIDSLPPSPSLPRHTHTHTQTHIHLH